MSNRLSTPPRAQGFSLVEFMVAITIGLFLVAGMATLITRNSAHRAEIEKASRQIENGRYAMQVLADELRHAGFYGEYYDIAAATLPAVLPNPCATNPSDLSDALPLHVQGYDAPATLPADLAACLPAANHVPGTDILVIRRTATTATPLAAVAPGRVYLQSRPSAAILADGANAASFTLKKKDTVTPADLRQYLVHIYFVSPCSVPATGTTCSAAADNGRPIPTLKRLELTDDGAGNRTMKIVPLVEGIETLQIDYGVDTNGNGAPDGYTTAPADTTAWSNVMAVRLNLVSRSTEPTAGHVDDKTYDLGLAGSFNAPAGVANYKRHAYAQVVRLVNPSARREQ